MDKLFIEQYLEHAPEKIREAYDTMKETDCIIRFVQYAFFLSGALSALLTRGDMTPEDRADIMTRIQEDIVGLLTFKLREIEEEPQKDDRVPLTEDGINGTN